MVVPAPGLRSSELALCDGNKDKTENHPLARKGDRLRMPGTDIDESFPELLLAGEVSACTVLGQKKVC
jgi:hypothetical protein